MQNTSPSSTQLWEAEKRYYAGVATGMVGRQMYVDEAKERELGYTKQGSFIYIAKVHPLFARLTSKEERLFRLGVTVHEALHQVFTDFAYDQEKSKHLVQLKHFKTNFELQIYHKLVNLVEDPAIETMASQVIGGPALKALDFTIAKVDELSGDFDEDCNYPFEEVINALIQFGDVGIIHGTFRFRTAEHVFREISPLFYKAINEPDNRKRIDRVFPIFLVCRKLWIGYSDNKLDELIKKISQKQDSHGKSDMNGTGSGISGSENTDSTKNRKRQATIRKVSKAEFDQAKQNAKPDKDVDRDIEILVCDEAAASGEVGDRIEEIPSTKNNCSKLNIAEPTHEESVQADGNLNVPPGDKPSGIKKPDGLENDTNGDENNDLGALQVQQEQDGSRVTKRVESDEELLEQIPVPEFSEEDYKKIVSHIEQTCEEVKAQQERIRDYYSELPEFDVLKQTKGFEGIEVINRYISDVKSTDSIHYDAMVEKMSDGISMMQEELRDIFYNDRMTKAYADSGRVSMKRLSSGRVSTRLFERKLRPAEKSNLCIGIAGDNSGSMSGVKIEQEILTLIALAETFAVFDIPLYFMGFNVPLKKPVQTHYIRWENSRFERERLLYLKAGGSNFDSYSIRYLTNLMMERSEKHKLMFILSDGQPSHHFNMEEGIRQNTIAIEDAKNLNINVVGIGIGRDARGDSFHAMYGKDSFFHVDVPQDLFDHLSKVITTIVNDWK